MTPDEYLAAVDPSRREDLTELDRLVAAAAPGLDRTVQGRMIGYGPFRYRYASGRTGEAGLIALSANARSISLHVLSEQDGTYLAETFADVGQSCNGPISAVNASRNAGQSATAPAGRSTNFVNPPST